MASAGWPADGRTAVERLTDAAQRLESVADSVALYPCASAALAVVDAEALAAVALEVLTVCAGRLETVQAWQGGCGPRLEDAVRLVQRSAVAADVAAGRLRLLAGLDPVELDGRTGPEVGRG